MVVYCRTQCRRTKEIFWLGRTLVTRAGLPELGRGYLEWKAKRSCEAPWASGGASTRRAPSPCPDPKRHGPLSAVPMLDPRGFAEQTPPSQHVCGHLKHCTLSSTASSARSRCRGRQKPIHGVPPYSRWECARCALFLLMFFSDNGGTYRKDCFSYWKREVLKQQNNAFNGSVAY